MGEKQKVKRNDWKIAKKTTSGTSMKQVAATALILLLSLFLLPLLIFRGSGGPDEAAQPTRHAAAGPTPWSVLTRRRTAAAQCRVQMGDGEVLSLPLDQVSVAGGGGGDAGLL